MQAHATDGDQAALDLGPLAWVLDELRKSLDAASAALRRYVRDTGLARGSDLASVDDAQLRIARQQLHQAVGALEMVGLPAPAHVLRSMEAAVQKFTERPELCSEAAAAKVERAGFALTQYLGAVLVGKSASPIALFPQYRDTQELTGSDRVHPADLWEMEFRWTDPDVPKPAEALDCDPALRSRMDQAVLRVVRSGDAAAGRELARLCLGLAAGAVERQPRVFWKLSAGYFEALALGLLPLDVYVKRAGSRVLMQYAALAKGDLTVSERLAQDLLFFCSQAAPPAGAAAPVLSAIRRGWGLTGAAAVDYQTPLYGRFDPLVQAQARKRLAAAKEAWSGVAGGDANKLRGLAEQFHGVTEVLTKLYPESAPLAKALNAAVDTVVQAGKAPAPELAMEVATAVLYLEAGFDELGPADMQLALRTARLAERLDHVRVGGKSEPLEPWIEELYGRVSDRQTMGSVVGELRGTLGELEKVLDAFFRQPTDRVALQAAPGHLSQMRGVLSVLGLDQAAQAVLRMREHVEQILVGETDGSEAQAGGAFERLGNNLGALGFLIDMLNYQPALAKKLFVYDDALGELRPLMGRSPAKVSPAATAAAAESISAEALSVITQAQDGARAEALSARLDTLAMQAILADQAGLAQTARDASAAVAGSDEVAATAALNTLAEAVQAAAPVAPPAAPPAADFEEDDLQGIFLEEAREVVQTGQAALAALADNPRDLSELTTLRRAFHTLKGSSRMVGLTEFGDAGWSFEQVLNTWLADQKPATDDLRTLCGDAFSAFGRWVDDIAARRDGGWKAEAFRQAADAMRTQQRLVALAVPAAAIDAAAAAATSLLENMADAPAAVAAAGVEPATEAVADAVSESGVTPSETAACVPVVDIGALAEAPTQWPGLSDDEAGEEFIDLDALARQPQDGAAAATGDTGPAPDPFDFRTLVEAVDQAHALDLDLSEPAPEAPGAAGESPEIAWDMAAPAEAAPPRPATEPPQADELAEAHPGAAPLPDSVDFELEFPAAGYAPAEVPAEMSAAAGWNGMDPAGDDIIDIDIDIDAEVADAGGEPSRAATPPHQPDTFWLAGQPAEPTAPAAGAEPEAEPEASAFPGIDFNADADADAAANANVNVNANANANANASVEPAADEPEVFPADSASPQDEQVKVIGHLRLGIPLYNVYLNEADEWSRRLLTEVSEWSLELNQRLPDSTVGLAHALAGASATVGFQALSDIARALEGALAHAQGLAFGTPQHGRTFTDAAEEIRRLLHQFAAGFLKQPDLAVLPALVALADLDVPTAAEGTVSALPVEDGAVTDSGAGAATGGDTAREPVHVAPLAQPAVTVPPPTVADAAEQDEDEEQLDSIDAVDFELFPIFEEEAAELMPQLGGALRQWVARPDNRSARDEVLRALHTLKGSARLAGALRLGELAHRLESEIEQIGVEAANAGELEPLLHRYDRLQAHFESQRVQASAPPAADLEAAAAAETDEAIRAAAEGPTGAGDRGADAQDPAVAGKRAVPVQGPRALALPAAMLLAPQRAAANHAVRVRSQLLDRLVNQAGEVMITRSRLEAELVQLRSSLTDLTGNLERLRTQLRDIELQAESQMQSRLAQAKEPAANFDPLEFDRFTRVQELTRMMAESVNDVATVQRNLQRTVEATQDGLIAQARQTRELQRDLLRTRMVEFEGISDRLYRVVRLASKETGKQVRLDITGGSIEMDRGVLDRMTPAFEHLLRNCVAHGIEEPAVRAAAGKDASGTIVINLSHEGNDVSVEFRDDGAGLDLGRIRQKALQQGLMMPGQVLDDREAANLIFMPGFSTAAAVTELAGRGIGMDVVRSEVNALGGRIETSTEVGRGTSFKLVLPLTTAVTQVVMVRTGNLSIGVPANLVETVLRVSNEAVQQAYASGTYEVGGEQLPFYWSGALLQASQRSAEPGARALTVVVFRSAAQRIAVHVDQVLGNQEAVVKNLGPQLARLPGLAGMTVLASGAVVLIYNPVALTTVYGEQARRLGAEATSGVAKAGGAAERMLPASAGPAEIPLVLVVDDSITVRRVTQRLLQREGYRVAMAADGLQALARLAEERPAVILSDIEMPRMDGFDLARNIRADQKLAGLPIIMITSRIAAKHREHAMALGVNHYLGKPYSDEELLSLVRHYCSSAVAA